MPVMQATVVKEMEEVRSLSERLGRSVSIFGSARTPSHARRYVETYEIAHHLARRGLAVISGGGPGIMRAANEGARAAGGTAVGFNITLPFEEPDDTFQDISLTFEHLFTRKLAFAYCSHAFIVMPGGLGTLDELFEILALIKTRKLAPKPIILVGRTFWTGLFDWVRDDLLSLGLVHLEDLAPITILDNPIEVLEFIDSLAPAASA